MNYMVLRDGQEYGPYTLGDLQRYVASGDILTTDLTRSEGMTDYLPVGQVIGTIPVPPVNTYAAPVVPAGPQFADPPNLHWSLVLLFSILTCGLFLTAWGIVQSVWARRVEPKSQSLFYYIGHAICLVLIMVASAIASATHSQNPVVSLLQLASFVVGIAARFSLKNTLELHYNSDEPMGLLLSGVMTFFFAEIYIQYHLNDIVRRKRLDRMEALSF